ncbi:efflux RND transporter periplasmic adaptor subunit [Terrihabitans soli]|nr:efflux RND transporter periplasmic adaptor subunit [Terrihabitans soli]
MSGSSEGENGSSVVASVKTDGSGAAQAAAPAATEGKKRPPPVEVAKARTSEASIQLESVGTLASDESVAIAAEVVGRISSINFKEGEPVKADSVLVTLDNLLSSADLAFADANLKLAESNFERATTLSKTGAGTARNRDEAQAALDTARAAYELARVRRDKTEIRAPFDGIVGLRAISVGAYAQVGQTLVNLEKIDTLKLDFRLPEINLRDVKVGQTVDIVVDAYPDRKFQGEVYAIDPLVDANGRALKIRARLANPNGELRPGLFARVRLIGASRGQVVIIPEGAIVPRGTDTVVFTVTDGKAKESKVRLGRRADGEVEILEGLAADATVVTAGQARVKNGQPVEIVQPQQPS